MAKAKRKKKRKACPARRGRWKSGPRKGRCKPAKKTTRKAAAKRKTCPKARRSCPASFEEGRYNWKTGKRYKRIMCISTKTGRARPPKCRK